MIPTLLSSTLNFVNFIGKVGNLKGQVDNVVEQIGNFMGQGLKLMGQVGNLMGLSGHKFKIEDSDYKSKQFVSL